MDLLKRHRLEPAEKLDELGIELGLSKVSLDAIGKYCKLLEMICKCLVLPKDQYTHALYIVHLREILSLWLRMVDNVYQRGGATWITLDNALYKVDEDTAKRIKRERKPSLTLVFIIISFLEEKVFEKKHFRSKTYCTV